jgi:hypothetical protein
MTTPDLRLRRSLKAACVAAVLVGSAVAGCDKAVPEEGTIDTRAAGIRPQRVHGKAAPKGQGGAPEAPKPGR